MRYAIEVEKQLSKSQILNNYLNISYFGAGAYGAEAASQRYFSKSANQLSLSQAALLAGLVSRPPSMTPPWTRRQRRSAATGSRSHAATGYINQEQRDNAVITPVASDLNPSEPANGCAASAYSYFCDYAVRQIRNDPRFGATAEERDNLLKTGGLSVTTTLDMNAQTSATDAVNSYIPGRSFGQGRGSGLDSTGYRRDQGDDREPHLG